ncbi:MAG: N-acetylmuramoyl-L-alanine amidase [Pseudomonadales bacterium]|nr:N-acetylmuramoyl-L-alanine amidase [Pseudomonadales bacterium]
MGLLCCVLIWAQDSQAADIRDVRLWRAPEYTRLVFDVDEKVQYSVFALENPYRIVIDISDAVLSGNLAVLDLKNSPVNAVRSAARNGNDLRVVLDMAAEVRPSSFTLPPNGEFGDRLVLDLYDDVPQTAVEVQVPPPQPNEERRDIIVAIDAGHGGEDPGAIGYNGRIKEKEVALAIAKAIHDRFRTIPGYEPILTRQGDYYVELQRRPQIARQNRADIFLSIHADSFSTTRAEGVTIYALSQRVAEDENIRRVQQKENGADLMGGVAGDTSLRNFEDDLALTLLDLSMAWSIEQSIAVGSHILNSLSGVARLRRDKTQQGNLWVLRSPDIPSLLIETGYLSNPEEARKLTTSGYQRRLADGIVQGVMNYFQDRPPEGTLVAWQKRNGIATETSYMVQRGDSLSVIAQRHGINTAQLRAANGLDSDVIHIGQQLRIPGSGAAFTALAEPVISEHRVSRGETLSGIAQQYGISLSRLREQNRLRGDTIRVGQKLEIPSY